MSWTTEVSESPGPGRTGVGASAPTAGMLRGAASLVGRGVSFWSAILLPLVAIALLAAQPSGWLAALSAVFAANAAALFFGHCHDLEC